MKKPRTGLYPTVWESNWKNPCILEHLLSDASKIKAVLQVFTLLGFKIEPYSNNKWFDIVKT